MPDPRDKPHCPATVTPGSVDRKRYPYTHHGPPVHGCKITDYLISELALREDCPELFDDENTGLM